MKHSLASILLLVLSACSSDGSSTPATNGSAPKISNMVLSPDTAKINQTVTISGTVDFEDADGDIKTLSAALKLSNGQVSGGDTAVQNLVGQKTGAAALTFAVNIPVEGAVEISATLIDAKGNKSNTLTKTIQAVK
jgi:hypothetical protein